MTETYSMHEDTDLNPMVVKHQTLIPPQITPYDGQAANTHIHAAVWISLGIFFFGILGIFAMTFRSSAETLFVLAICTLYLFMYLGGPLIFMHMRGESLKDDMPLAEFLERPFSTHTGIISGREAWLQICIIPGALFFAALGMGLIITSVV